MKIPEQQAISLGLEALERLAGAPLTDQQRFLLGDCVEAYLPLDPMINRHLTCVSRKPRLERYLP